MQVLCKVKILVPALMLFLMVADSLVAGGSGLVPQAVVRAKEASFLSAQARSYLNDRDGDTARVWVFFTDKKVSDKKGFDRAAASITLTERALKRRAKVGNDRVLFVDLAVPTQYVEQIEGLGGKHRRSSRWLNAASFEIPADRLDEVGSLPFVAYLKPLMFYRHTPETIDVLKSPPQPGALAPDALNYGPSYNQLDQIGVTAMHDQGYTGAGVTLAIFDTGFRKSHNAFALHYAEGRVIGERDFVQGDDNTANEAGDATAQWNHGTYIWSVSGGAEDGFIYGPAYKANFILCKTEDISSETPVEEDNWVAAVEYADSLGADVITSSLAYMGWDDGSGYTYADLNGRTATTTLAANMCDSLGIVLCNAMANSGPYAGTLHAPADAFNILSIGAVSSSGAIAGFSSRGPTFDGRIKPEVCARGVSTYAASSGSDGSHTYVHGTSLSTPLVAGAACLLIEARPEFTPTMIREALKMSADNAISPNNTFGWGVINVDSARVWGASFSAENRFGAAPLEVSFTSSTAGATEWLWDFGDGEFSNEEHPTHTYGPGTFSVELVATTPIGDFPHFELGIISAFADTLTAEDVRKAPGNIVKVDILAHNFLPLKSLMIPFSWSGPSAITYDSFSTAGLRTDFFELNSHLSFNSGTKQATISLKSTVSGEEPYLEPGDGAVASLWFTIPEDAVMVPQPIVISSINGYFPALTSPAGVYMAQTVAGSIFPTCCTEPTVGNVDCSADGIIDVGDVTVMISKLFITLDAFCCESLADIDNSGLIDIGDLTLLISALFIHMAPLGECP